MAEFRPQLSLQFVVGFKKYCSLIVGMKPDRTDGTFAKKDLLFFPLLYINGHLLSLHFEWLVSQNKMSWMDNIFFAIYGHFIKQKKNKDKQPADAQCYQITGNKPPQEK